MDAQFAAIVADAAKQYKLSTNSKKGVLFDDFTLNPPLKTVDQLIAIVDKQNEQFSNFREKRHGLFKTLTLAMKPIEIVGEAACGPASEVFAPSAHVLAAVMYMIRAAENVSKMYDSIEELFGQLKDFTGRLNVYAKHTMSDTLRQKLVTILATVFQIVIIATQEVRQGRLKSYFKRLLGSGSPVDPAMEKLRILTLGEERQVIAETYGGVADINDKTDRVEDLVIAVNENLQNLNFDHLGQLDIERRDRLRNILQPSPFPKDFYTAFERSRVAGTGDWLLKDESLQAWFRGDKPFLWMNGSPGTGKSFLTSHIITHCLETMPRLAYFFFRDTGPETRSCVQALRDLAYQMSEADASYGKALMNSLYSSDDIRTVPSAFRRLFIEPHQMENCLQPTFIFLDGIDEADADEMSQLLFQMGPEEEDFAAGPRCSALRFALVGRSYMTETITQALDRDSSGDLLLTIQITPDRSADDVSAYIARGILQSRILNQTTNEFKDKVVRLMEAQVDGLFILAKFMLAEVNRKRHPRSILKSLETYPKEINGMLEKTLESLSAAISEEEAEDLNEMLRWIICAEQALTLEQLEAALILFFGDPPFRLEETLRGQYSCFFELEREDGMTTDDLIKDYERRQRELRRTGTAFSRISPTGRGSVDESAISDRGLSPLRHTATAGGRKSSVSSVSTLRERRGSGSPASPARSIDPVITGSEMEFRSKKSTTVVTFFHTTVREFFLNLKSAQAEHHLISRIKFDPVEARLHVVKTCLRIFTDEKWFQSYNLGSGRKAIKQYAAWYWQEHMACLDPTLVSAEEKRNLGVMIYRMLNDEATIVDWTSMYQKNDEGLDVLMERNLRALLRWFQDQDVVAGLSPQGQAFAAELKVNPSMLCEAIGRYYARCWVAENCQVYIPTMFCFDIVQSVALRQAGYMWEDEENHWLEIDLDERMLKAIAWTNCKESGHLNRRVGSTYLALGKHEKALKYYEKALAMDDDKQQTLGRISWCLYQDERYYEALAPALDCVKLEEACQAEGKYTGAALDRSKWRLYKDYYLAAQCYYSTYQTELAMEYFLRAIKASTGVALNEWERFEAEISYLEALSDESRYTEMMKLLHEMSLQLTNKTQGQNRLVELVLNQNNKRLVIDRIPKAASKTGEAEFILRTLEQAISAAHDIREPVVILYLRLAYGIVCSYSYKIESAIAVFEQISLVEYRARGNFVTRQGHAISFQRLAHLYKLQLLREGLSSPAALDWIERLEVVMKKQDEQRSLETPASIQGSDINTAALYLGLFYRLLGRHDESREILSILIVENLALLSDPEPLNDEFAIDNLLWLLLAAGDVEKARCLAQSMRNVNPNVSMQSTQSESPVLERPEPKLMNILSTDRCCAQCLENIPSTDDFRICVLCMESFCEKCITTIICVDGNSTADHKDGVQCRQDHDWFTVPTLNRNLHTGQIMGVDGRVREFETWTEEVRAAWT